MIRRFGKYLALCVLLPGQTCVADIYWQTSTRGAGSGSAYLRSWERQEEIERRDRLAAERKEEKRRRAEAISKHMREHERRLEQEKKDLQELSKATTAVATWKRKYIEALNAKEKLEQQIDEFKIKIGDAEDEKAELVDECQWLTNKITRLKKEFETLEKESEKKKQEMENKIRASETERQKALKAKSEVELAEARFKDMKTTRNWYAGIAAFLALLSILLLMLAVEANARKAR